MAALYPQSRQGPDEEKGNRMMLSGSDRMNRNVSVGDAAQSRLVSKLESYSKYHVLVKHRHPSHLEAIQSEAPLKQSTEISSTFFDSP